MTPCMGIFLASSFLCVLRCFLVCVYPIISVLVRNSLVMKLRLTASVYERSKLWELESGYLITLVFYDKNPQKQVNKN